MADHPSNRRIFPIQRIALLSALFVATSSLAGDQTPTPEYTSRRPLFSNGSIINNNVYETVRINDPAEDGSAGIYFRISQRGTFR